MIAPLAKFIDWSVLQIGYAMLLQSMWREAANERDLKLEQAVQFLNLSQAEQVVGQRVRGVILRRRAACEELDRTRQT